MRWWMSLVFWYGLGSFWKVVFVLRLSDLWWFGTNALGVPVVSRWFLDESSPSCLLLSGTLRQVVISGLPACGLLLLRARFCFWASFSCMDGALGRMIFGFPIAIASPFMEPQTEWFFSLAVASGLLVFGIWMNLGLFDLRSPSCPSDFLRIGWVCRPRSTFLELFCGASWSHDDEVNDWRRRSFGSFLVYIIAIFIVFIIVVTIIICKFL